MATFARGHHARHTHAHNQRELKLGTTATTQPAAKIRWYQDPADTITLRGIPAIGRGVAGHIPHTRPDTIDHDQGDKAA